MEIVKMKSTIQFFLILTLFFSMIFTHSCTRKIESSKLESKIEFSNKLDIDKFSPKDLLPEGATLIEIPGIKQKWITGDIDNDKAGEIIFAFTLKKGSEASSLLRAILLKQFQGRWLKIFDFQEQAEKLDLIKFCDITGDNKEDLVVGWVIQSELKQNRLYMYQWHQDKLEGISSMEYSRIQIEDFEGVYGKDKQNEFGVWTETEDSLTIDLIRYIPVKTITSLFPSEQGQDYVKQFLFQAEDIEANYFATYAIPALLELEKEFPNNPMYDLATIKGYLKAKMPDLALKKINLSEDMLYNKDQDQIPLLQAQAYFLKGEINKGNKLLETVLSKKVNRIDAGETLKALGRAYLENKEYDKANLAFRNAILFHIPYKNTTGYQPETQFQYSLAKDKARLEILKQYDDLKTKTDSSVYRNNFQNKLISINKSGNLPSVTFFRFYLSLDEYFMPYANIISWKDHGKMHEIVFMTFDDDQHKIKYNYLPVGLINEKTRKGWQATITFKELAQTGKEMNEINKTFTYENGNWKFR